MAEIITAKGTGFFIEKVIRGARERIVLISPYLKVQKLYLDELKSAAKKGIPISILFREDEAKQEQLDALTAIENIKLFCLPELHAKCYFNEHRFVLTSMNLHDHSERNNKELGIMLEQGKDEPLFQEALDGALNILETGKPYGGTKSPRIATGGTGTRSTARPSTPSNKPGVLSVGSGYCIRTGVQIPFNVERPLCSDAYKAWNKFGNAEYPEKFCHFSGEPSNGSTCMKKPILSKNWNKAKAAFDL